MARKILGALEVFLGIFESTKEKKDRVDTQTAVLESTAEVWISAPGI